MLPQEIRKKIYQAIHAKIAWLIKDNAKIKPQNKEKAAQIHAESLLEELVGIIETAEYHEEIAIDILQRGERR